MVTRFEIAELRTLVARALATSDYQPAESARVRAVPDTRTIRYYTTLGLISPPSEMRGRTAFYDQSHVLQIVAIKRLQSQNLTLSDIQQKLVGLTKNRLSAIAKLPDGFWEAAEEYLAKAQRRGLSSDARRDNAAAEKHVTKSARSEPVSYSEQTSDEVDPFWLRAAALPSPANVDTDRVQDSQVLAGQVYSAIRIRLGDAIVTIELPDQNSTSVPDLLQLQQAAQPLIEELRRQKLIDP